MFMFHNLPDVAAYPWNPPVKLKNAFYYKGKSYMQVTSRRFCRSAYHVMRNAVG